jgi:hypothetical protein
MSMLRINNRPLMSLKKHLRVYLLLIKKELRKKVSVLISKKEKMKRKF